MTLTETAQAADTFDLTGRRAVVTGASRGIGRAITLGFASRGAQVVAVARSADDLDETSRLSADLDGAVFPVVADLCSSDDGPAQMVARAAELLGGIDVLVNNAGYDNEQGVDDTTTEEWDKVIDLNVRSQFLLCRAASPYLKDGGAKVINIASIFGHVGTREEIAYITSKHAVMGMTKALALEWARKDVQVNALCPGFVDTDMIARAVSDDATAKYLRRMTPLGRWAQPEEMVGPAVFLASAASDFMTGQALIIDGGYTAQ
ncbi:SDR family oxidoreductase [Nocardioides panacisoli]|uniref:SDR family NAD(P)-dependent oxidoreductase n=1 Tax=Nocardioides panacisoli TaxID=627624 RepID=UPI001C6313AD|nr:SDR family oxidoreductase [Nocardioides panacisoli]QYJ03520.1 SDR family oxidoreductase [Nocardioides panacisoli]